MVKTTKGDRRYWKCIVPFCTATANTHFDNITKLGNHHSHAPNTTRVNAEAVLNTIKQICAKETTPITAIYEEDRAELRSAEYMDINPDHEDVIAELPSFYETRMRFYRSRNTR